MKYLNYIMGVLLITSVALLLSCVADKAPLAAHNSLVADELAYYSDDFDEMRKDLWDRVGYLYREEQMQNFRQADLRFTNGELIIRTQTGSFSKGGLSSKYAISGDFDVQLDVRMDLRFGSFDIDQVFSFVVLDKNIEGDKLTYVSIGLSMKGGSIRGNLFSNCSVNGRRKSGGSEEADNFNGSLRILRTGEFISTLYKLKGTSGWTQMSTFHVTDGDMLIGFQLRNFFAKRTSIKADHSISAAVERFKVNAARAIIEEEI